MIPAKIGTLLAEGSPLVLPGSLNTNDSCCGSKFHSPTPLLVSRVRLIPSSWPDVQSGKVEGVWLCGTCAENLAVYQHLLLQCGGNLDWPVARCFGNLIRALGQRSWELYAQVDQEVSSD